MNERTLSLLWVLHKQATNTYETILLTKHVSVMTDRIITTCARHTQTHTYRCCRAEFWACCTRRQTSPNSSSSQSLRAAPESCCETRPASHSSSDHTPAHRQNNTHTTVKPSQTQSARTFLILQDMQYSPQQFSAIAESFPVEGICYDIKLIKYRTCINTNMINRSTYSVYFCHFVVRQIHGHQCLHFIKTHWQLWQLIVGSIETLQVFTE